MKKIGISMMRVSAAAFLAAVSISILAAGCGAKKDGAAADGKAPAAVAEDKATKADKKGEAESAAPAFAVNTTKAAVGRISDYLTLSGDVVAGSTVDVYSDVAGKVVKLLVAEGARVEKDAPIAEIDPSKPGMTFIPGVAKAPIAGTIVSLPAQLGMTITQATPVARISRTEALEVRTYAAERFIFRLRVGQRAEVILDAYPGKVFSAAVTELSPTVDAASRTMEVRLVLSGSGGAVKAGMFAKVKVITEEKAGIVKIPAAALVKRFGETYAFTVEADPADPALLVARRKSVSAGLLVDGVQEILSGLSGGEEVVVRGQTLLEDGSRVNVIDRAAPAAAKE